MKSETKQSSIKRANSQSSFATSCKVSDNCTSHNRLHRMVGQHRVMMLLLLISIGLGLGTAATQAQTRAYVTTPSTVSVIDTATNTVITSIPVGALLMAIAITPDGSRAYVIDGLEDTVSAIDTATNTVVATVSLVGTDCAQTLCLSPFGIAITPDGTRAYVANSTSSTVSVINTATNIVDVTIPSGGSGLPAGVAITPDGTQVYVTKTGSAAGDVVSVINTATNTVVGTISIGAGSAGIAVAMTPDGSRAYVTISDSDTVLVIDTATKTVVGTIPVGVFPDDIAITPDGTRAYVTNSNSNTVSVIDTATNTVVGTIPVGLFPFAVAITPDGSRAYVTVLNSGNVSVIDTATNTVLTTIDGLAGFGIAMTPMPLIPKTKDQCKHGGYLKFGPPAGPFKNQGQCVSYVEHH